MDINTFYALVDQAVESCQTYASLTDVEPNFVSVLHTINSSPSLRNVATSTFIEMIRNDKDTCGELIGFCMHELRWEEVRHAVVEEIETCNIRKRQVLSGILASFDNEWPDAAMFDYFAPPTLSVEAASSKGA